VRKISERSKTETLMAQWSAQLKIPIDELRKRFNEKYQTLTRALPGKSPEFYEKRARFLLYRELKTMLRFPGISSFDGVFFGYNQKMDVFARRREQALAIFASNPTLAIDQGWTDETGKPIFKMPSGGVIDISKPIYLRQSVGLVRPSTGGDWKLAVMVHRMDQVENIPPLLRPVRFTARKTSEFPDKFVLGTTRGTSYEPVDIPEFENLDDAKVCELLRKAPPSLQTNCFNIRKWHDEHAGDNTRICIIEGDVVFLRREPTRIGNALFVIEDETLMDLTAEGITVWVHPEIFSMLNFGAGSRVIVVGRTVLMPGWDPMTRQVDRTRQRVGLNAFAVYAEPEFKVPPEEEMLISEDIL